VDKDELHVRETFGTFELYAVSDPEPALDNRCYCAVPQDIDGSCMRCGGVVDAERACAPHYTDFFFNEKKPRKECAFRRMGWIRTTKRPNPDRRPSGLPALDRNNRLAERNVGPI
jgi:hypothetical protein